MLGFEQGYALIVGIANYPNVSPLPPTVLKDARDIAAMLQRPDRAGYPSDQVKLLLNEQATKQGVLDGLKWLADSAKGDATATFYFSGHGANLPDGPNKGNYLVTYDTVLTGKPNYVKHNTILSSNELTAALNAIQTQKMITLLDACHSGGTGATKDGLGVEEPALKTLDASAYEQLKQGSGRIIFASSKTDEVSFVMPGAANSLFTECMLEALDGKAKTDGDGTIRIFDVVSYVFTNVSQRQPKQHPIFKVNDLDANFPMALYRGGEKALAIGTASTTAADLRALVPNVKPMLDVTNEVALRDFLAERFVPDELETLCTDVAKEITNGTGKPTRLSLATFGAHNKGLELAAQLMVQYLNRRSQLPYLVKVLHTKFPSEVPAS
jgi:hypothetical protein